MPVNKTAVTLSVVAAITLLLVVALVQLPAILHGPTAAPRPVPAPTPTTGTAVSPAGNGVSLDPDICGSQHTADISIVEQRCKMLCPPGQVYADYHPNQVCTYLWTHAGNAVTLIYPEGQQVTLDVRN
jgi:hypothetical protein